MAHRKISRTDRELTEIHLQPGESCLVNEKAVLCTLLGSCLGITFWAPRLHLGALCHPMLPCYTDAYPSIAAATEATRYVDYAIRDLLAQLEQRGAKRSEIEVKLFGGADVLRVFETPARKTVGKQNIQMAERVLSDEGIAIRARRLGGTKGIALRFHTETGEVLVRTLQQTH